MTDIDIDAIRQRLAEWRRRQDASYGLPGSQAERASIEAAIDCGNDADALLAKVDELTAEREHMELNPTGTAEWLKHRVNELVAALAAKDAVVDAVKVLREAAGRSYEGHLRPTVDHVLDALAAYEAEATR